MADYENMTVAKLRVLLKDRGIPSTGLTRKVQIVKRLQEDDAASTTAQDETVAGEPIDEPAEDPAVEAEPAHEVVTAPEQVADAPEPNQSEPVAKEMAEFDAPISQEDNRKSQEPQIATDNGKRDHAQAATQDAAAAVPEPSSPMARGTKSNRSLSQTPLPSREEPVPLPEPQKSVDSTPSATRENTAATSQTDQEERMKRKRRSGSPSIDTQELAIKRARVAEEVHLKEDPPVMSSEAVKDIVMSEGGPVRNPEAKEESGRDHGIEGIDMAERQDCAADKGTETGEAKTTSQDTRDVVNQSKAGSKVPKDNRYQDLLATDQSAVTTTPIPVDELPTPPPSLHSATRALYVRNFMRPLQLTALRSHILSLAGLTDDEEVEILYVDSVRSHAFILVKSAAAAAKIRAGLHDQVWPAERDRKPLWADYIPAESVTEWIKEEESSAGGPRPGGRKWEVVYEQEDGNLVARHIEAGATRAMPAAITADATGSRQPSGLASLDRDRQASARPQPEEAAKSFLQLDKLFKSTQAKPMLYYMPLEDKVANSRLDEIDELTSKRWSSRDWKEDDELRRYTFEDSRLVDSGRHNVQRRAANANRGAPSSRYGRGPPRGSYRGQWR